MPARTSKLVLGVRYDSNEAIQKAGDPCPGVSLGECHQGCVIKPDAVKFCNQLAVLRGEILVFLRPFFEPDFVSHGVPFIRDGSSSTRPWVFFRRTDKKSQPPQQPLSYVFRNCSFGE